LRAYLFVKRALDVALAGVAIVALLPIGLLIAIMVRLSSPGKIFFRQWRVGLRAVPFQILKFRSMAMGAVGAGVTSAADRRVTRVGRFLRRYKLDELPQFWNVLVGDMSLVGPRPELQRFVDRFEADYQRILSIRPGLTDYASLEYRDEEHILVGDGDVEQTYVDSVLPAKIALYHRYLTEMSLATDLRLIGRTLLALFR